MESVDGYHDFHVVSFTPRVCLHVDIKPNEGQDMISYYKGVLLLLLPSLVLLFLLLVLLPRFFGRFFKTKLLNAYQFLILGLQAKHMFG